MAGSRTDPAIYGLLDKGKAVFYETGNPDSLLYYARQALMKSKVAGSSEGEAASLKQIGNAFFYKEDLDESLKHYRQALSVALSSQKETTLIGELHNNIGAVLLKMEKQPEAMYHLLKAAKIYESTKNYAGVSLTYLNIAGIFEVQNQPKNVIKYTDRAVAYIPIVEDTFKMVQRLNLAANLYQNHETEKALRIATNAYAIVNENQLAPLKTELEVTLTILYNLKKEYQTSLKYGQRCIANRASIVSSDLFRVYTCLADNYLNAQKTDSAAHFIELAKEIDIEDNVSYYYKALYTTSYKVNKLQDNYEAALSDLEVIRKLEKELFKKEQSAAINNLEIKYETQKRKARIRALKKDNETIALQSRNRIIFIVSSVIILVLILLYRNAKIRSRNKLIEQELRMRLLRSQLNPHFVSNAISTIQGLILDGKESAITISDHISRFSKLIREIMNQSEVQQIDLDREIEFLTNYLKIQQVRFNNSFEYQLKVDPELDAISPKLPAMMIQPFIENAIEHGAKNRDEGIVSVDFKLEEESIKVSVFDNGKELPETTKKRTDRLNSLSVIRERMAILNKRKRGYSFETKRVTQPESGTLVEIYIPV